jgi:hypothetical protein
MLAALAIVARLLCILIGLFSLLGMAWIGKVTPMIAAGFLGFAAAVMPVWVARPSRARIFAVIACAALALIAQAVDVIYYYAKMNFPGNYYGWGAAIIYFAGFGMMLADGLFRLGDRKA